MYLPCISMPPTILDKVIEIELPYVSPYVSPTHSVHAPGPSHI